MNGTINKLITITTETAEKIKKIAAEEKRSEKSQIEWIIKSWITEREKAKKEEQHVKN